MIEQTRASSRSCLPLHVLDNDCRIKHLRRWFRWVTVAIDWLRLNLLGLLLLLVLMLLRFLNWRLHILMLSLIILDLPICKSISRS